MNRLYIILVFLGGLFLPAASSWAGQFTVLAFGDSITQGLQRNASGAEWGVRSPQHGTRLPNTNGDMGYSPVLEKLVRNESGGKNIAYVYNWGFRGERTTDGVNRISSVLASRPADFILIMEGANDLYAGINVETTKFNVGKMADKSLAKGVLPILGGVTPNTNRSDGYIVWQYYFPLIGKAADERGIPFVDMYNPFAGPRGELWAGLNSGDGLHLNSSGYRLMAALWDVELEKVLHSSSALTVVPWISPLLLNGH